MTMKSGDSTRIRWCAIACCIVLGWGGTWRQVAAHPVGIGVKSKDGQAEAVHAGKADADTDRIALERRFEQTMSGARLEGVSQMTGEGGLTGDRSLSPPRKDAYVINKVRKLEGDRWLIFARISFGDKDVNVPVPVRVVWAGDTAVITLDDVGVPLIGTYSARVMIHHGFYSGIWYSNAKNYGGVMAGRIIREPTEAEKESSSTHGKDAARHGD